MATVLLLAGAFGQPQQVAAMLGGSVVQGNIQVPVNYPNWGIGSSSQLQQGAAALNTAITSTSGEIIVMAHSLGSVVCCYWLQNYGPTSGISPSILSFILLGNSNRPYGGFCKDIGWFQNADIPTSTPFNVADVARQYDGWADWPQLTTGTGADILAAADNGLLGQGLVHPNYQNVSLTASNNVTYVVGNITYYFCQSYPVPLLGVSQAGVAVADAALRPDIEAAYNRVCGALPAPDYNNYP